jgi:hypothetical protein
MVMASISSLAFWGLQRRLPLLGLAVVSLSVTAWAQTRSAQGQPPRRYKEDHPRDVPIAEQTTARGMLRTGVVTDANLLATVYQWRCSQLTWASKVNETADLRARLRSDLRAAERAAKPDAFDRLTPLVLKSMLAIAHGPEYHPAARLNAMLLLGDLDARVTAGGTTRFVPHPEALPHLLAAVGAPGETVSGVDDSLRCAALHSLVRHGKAAGQDSADRQAIIKAALAVASNDVVPKGRSQEVHEWVRRRSVIVLESTIKAGASDLDVAASDRLRALIADRGLALKLRLDAAQAFGRTNTDRATDALTGTQLARALGGLTLDLLNAEVVPAGKVAVSLRSVGSRELLAQGVSKISLALRTVEVRATDNQTATAADKPNSADPSAVQYLRSRLAAVRKTINDPQATDGVAAGNSTLLANDLNAWLDREAVVQATDSIPDAMDDG